MRRGILVAVLLAAMPSCLVHAQSQPPNQTQNQLQNVAPDQAQNQTRPDGQPSAIAYSGTFVCEKAPGSADILNVPADLAIRGDQVAFARPLFNLRGTRVLGSEMAAGSIDPGGTVHLTSTWTIRGITVHGDYRGTLTPSGGALTGIQSWRGLDGAGHSRTCQIALVSVANANRAAMQ